MRTELETVLFPRQFKEHGSQEVRPVRDTRHALPEASWSPSGHETASHGMRLTVEDKKQNNHLSCIEIKVCDELCSRLCFHRCEV